MFWLDLLFILLFALLLSSILAWGFGWRHPAAGDAVGTSAIFLFFILLFMMWSIGSWMQPFGAVAYGTRWLGLLLVGIFVSLLMLAVAAPVRRARTPRQSAAATSAFGAFFWILVLALLIAGALSYLF